MAAPLSLLDVFLFSLLAALEILWRFGQNKVVAPSFIYSCHSLHDVIALWIPTNTLCDLTGIVPGWLLAVACARRALVGGFVAAARGLNLSGR